MLAAGREVLLSDGLGSGAEHLSFKRVLGHIADTQGIRITNASVIGRVWESQEAFQLDVIRSVVDQQVEDEVEVVSETLAEALGRVDVSSPAMRRASLAELIRVTCDEYMQAASTSAASIQMALVTYVAASEMVGGDSSIIESFRATEDRLTLRYIELYEVGLAYVGWRIRPGLSIRDAALALSAFAEGVLLRQIVEPEAFHPILRVRELDGREVEWSLFAIGMDKLVDFFTEPDPDWTGGPPGTDPGTS